MNPDALVSAVAERVRASLPPGLAARDLDGFLARNRGRLVVQLRAALKVEAELVAIPWRAGELSGPASRRIGRFDAEKAKANGVRWSREADDLEPGFDPPEHVDAYDLIAIQVSGGKDSVACITALHRLIGHRRDLWSKVELWHQDVDGAAEPFMDWPVTRAYVLGLGALYDVPLRFAWREGGFHRELMRRQWGKRAGKVLETPEGPVMIGEPPPPNNLGRRRFPALTADLRIRWCSGFLKIDVARTLLARSVAEGSKKILVISGERAAESAPRSRYHRGQDTEGSSGRRQIHQLRLVYDHSDAEVWDELRLAFPGKNYAIQPHPALCGAPHKAANAEATIMRSPSARLHRYRALTTANLRSPVRGPSYNATHLYGGRMLEDHLRSRGAQRRLRAGLCAPYIDSFATWLHVRGLRPLSIDDLLGRLATWSDWMGETGQTIHALPECLRTYSAHLDAQQRLRSSSGARNKELGAASSFTRFLREQRVLPDAPSVPRPSEKWPILGDFRMWMKEHRGLSASTMATYERVVITMLNSLGINFAAYSAENVREYVLEAARPHGVMWAKSIATSTRAFLRFLGATGSLSPDLLHAIPAFARWRNVSVPRHLQSHELQQVVDACRGEDICGRRDRAIILLLARLGLRAGDIVGLTLGDIDWANARIAVCGKGRRRQWLPLSQDVGDALLQYISLRGAGHQRDALFVTVRPPRRALHRRSVSNVTLAALQRAGISSSNGGGAHLFRHSAATAMLREGVSLSGVGAVLRHRSLSTTTHYAKVDYALLLEVARPWPGGESC